ncbi:MAG TPA: lysylphosphatidylglycerol synthase domain-containing protein, partial [Thermoanaerobaculia bacterium]
MKRVERIGFAAGVLLLCWLLWRIGPDALLANLSEVGWGFVLVLALHGFNVLFNSLAWRRLLPADHPVPLPALAEMQIAGDAVNAVNPLGVVGGELMRVRLLSRVVPVSAATASVGLVATAQFVSQILFVLSGTPLTIHWIKDAGIRKGLWFLCALLLVLFALVLWLALSRTAFPAIRNRLRDILSGGDPRSPRAWL